MDLSNNLTYLQKAAIRGEVAYAFATSSHNTEIKFRTYLILREVKEQYRSAFVQAIKEAVTLSDEVIDALYLESQSNEVPVWLWVEEVIEDIKLYTKGSATSLMEGTHLCIDRDAERKKLIESAFVLFARKALFTSPTASEQLFAKILEDDSLDFLHTACFYLKTCCPELKSLKGDKVPEDILDCCFNIKEFLIFNVETKALEKINSQWKKPKKNRVIKDEEFFKNETDHQLEAIVSQEELSNFLSEKISELFTEVPNSGISRKAKFKVIKVFPDSGISIPIKTCSTAEEAENFIKKVEKEYPELLKSCKFEYYREDK